MLSVVIPTFNNANFLPIAIASAISLKDLGEIIIIDDCSTDHTESVVKTFQNQSKKIKYYKNTRNLGVGFSFIKAIDLLKFPARLRAFPSEFNFK